MSASPSVDPAPVVTVGIAAHATVVCPFADVPRLRDRPAAAGVPPLPPRFLRHCDEHTVVGMQAVLAALASDPGLVPGLAAEGIVAAPCQAGRPTTARTLAQLAHAGAVAVTPHVVPQCSLHSLAGAISVALGMHGPHLGVGGGSDALAEGLFAACSLLVPGSGSECSAIWFVGTGWQEEPWLDATGAPPDDALLRAVAVRLVADAGTAPAVLGLDRPGGGSRRHAAGDLATFATALAAATAGDPGCDWTAGCPWGADVRLTTASRVLRPVASLRHREAA